MKPGRQVPEVHHRRRLADEAASCPMIRVVDSTGALLLDVKPERMLVIGGGIIGLKWRPYSTLGARIDVVEMLDG